MSKRSTRYSEEFKQQIIDLYNTGNNKVSCPSGEYGISTVTIYKWIKELSPIKISDTEEISAKVYNRMQKRIAELEMENEILKKATVIFARSSYYKALVSVPSKRQLEAERFKKDISIFEFFKYMTKIEKKFKRL